MVCPFISEPAQNLPEAGDNYGPQNSPELPHAKLWKQISHLSPGTEVVP
jgi:hypothetical protein